MELVYKINDYFDKYQDPRVANWPAMASPFYPFLISLGYVYTIKILGPNLMNNRKPYQLKNVLVIYNFLQVLVSCYLFYEIGMSGWFTGEYNFRCQPVDYSNSPSGLRMLNVAWWYYISKISELIDTVLFILRKKYDQVSALHVLHHGLMPILVWMGIKIIPGGHGSFFGLLNSFVHIIMYTYYMLSACGPQMQKYLWWKRYLTVLQMSQFVAVQLHTFQLLFIDCDFPTVFVFVIGGTSVFFFFLFAQFYKRAYNRVKGDKARRRVDVNSIVVETKKRHLQ